MTRLSVATLLLLGSVVMSHALQRYQAVGGVTAPRQANSQQITIACPAVVPPQPVWVASSSSVVYQGGTYAVDMGKIRVITDGPSGVSTWKFQFQNLHTYPVGAIITVVCLR